MKKKYLSLMGVIFAAVVLGACNSNENATVEAEPVQQAVEETVVSEIEEVEETEETVEEEVPEADSEEEQDIAEEKSECPLEDGIYIADFDTDSGMFHVNETLDGKGELIVENSNMTIHITLAGKGILNLYPGTAEQAQADGAVLLEPTVDTVTYEDGMSEEVYGFDLPVPCLDEEFDCALIGKKGVWYDHKVSVSSVKSAEEAEDEAADETAEEVNLEEGEYEADIILEGGSGKAKITSPAKLTVSDEGITAVIEWSSPNYDFMMIGDEKYLPINTEGNSIFEIPVSVIGAPMEVQADTVAMSEPHLIDYTLTFNVVE